MRPFHALALGAGMALAAPVAAAITIFNNPGAVNPDENLLLGDSDQTGTTIVGTTNETSMLGTGENFIGARATDGQFITRAFFTTDGTMEDARQFRLGGFGDVGALGVIPEPASWAMLLMGFGAIGNSLRRRRHSFATRLS